MMSLLGGIQTFFGPILGAMLYWELQNNISQVTKYWPAVIGIVFVIFVLCRAARHHGARRGHRHLRADRALFAPRATSARARRGRRQGRRRILMPDVFRTEHLTRRFAGFTAVNDVSLAIPEGGVRTIIGPNGAGKRRLQSALRSVPPSEGRIFFRDRDITELPSYQRAGSGLHARFRSPTSSPGSPCMRTSAGRQAARRQGELLPPDARPGIDPRARPNASCATSGSGKRATRGRRTSRTAISGGWRSASCSPAIRRSCCSTSRSRGCRRPNARHRRVDPADFSRPHDRAGRARYGRRDADLHDHHRPADGHGPGHRHAEEIRANQAVQRAYLGELA